jgi:hypothetical protein
MYGNMHSSSQERLVFPNSCGTLAAMVTTVGGEHVNRGRETPSLERFSTIDMLSAVSILVVALPTSKFPEGLINYSVESM